MSKIDVSAARDVAKRFLAIQTNNEIQYSDGDINHSITILSENTVKEQLKPSTSEKCGEACFYIFTLKGNGYVFVSAEDKFNPILGYSLNETIDVYDLPPILVSLMDDWRKLINSIRENNTATAENVSASWDLYMGKTSNIKQNVSTRSKSYNVNNLNQTVEPLIKTQWKQRGIYNYYCPVGYPAGCTSIAMAQVIRYYEWPKKGRGTHQYDDSSTPGWDFTYNTPDDNSKCPGLSIVKYECGSDSIKIDYENTEYDYFNMPAYISSGKDGQKSLSPEERWSAALVRHCGIAVNMDFWSAGSHPDLGKGGGVCNYEYIMGLDALNEHFRYNNASQKHYYNGGWQKTVRACLDEYRPVVFYSLNDMHVFIMDGYGYSKSTGDCYYHYNFGWGGNGDGYYLDHDIKPENYDFTWTQYVCTNLKPDTEFTIVDITNNFGGFKGLVENAKESPIFPYGKSPAVKGYDKRIKIKNFYYEVNGIDYLLDSYSLDGGYVNSLTNQNEVTLKAYQLTRNCVLKFFYKPIRTFTIDGVEYKALTHNTVEVISISVENCTIPENVSFNGINYTVVQFSNSFKSTVVKKLTANYINRIIPNFSRISNLESLEMILAPGIEAGAFKNLYNLKNVKLPRVTKVSDSAFTNCQKLEVVEMTNVHEVANNGFENCVNLKSFTFDYLNRVGASAFKNCINIKSLGNSDLREIGDNAFNGCSNLVVNSCNATKIGKCAFKGCKAINALNLPNLIELGDGVFESCENLDSISMPKIVYIQDNTFKNCKKLTSLSPTLLRNVGEYAFYNCNLSTSLTLASVEKYAFYHAIKASSSVSLTFDSNCNEIGSKAFEGCKGINTIISYATEPPICNGDTFGGIAKGIDVFVPYSSIQKYSIAEGWKQFTNIKAIQVEQGGVYYRMDSTNTATVVGGNENIISNHNIHYFVNAGFSNLIELKKCIEIENYITIGSKKVSIESVSDSAFKDKTFFESLWLNNNLSKIGDNAFNNIIGNCTTILVQNTNPISIKWNVFKKKRTDSLKSITLYVPSKSVDSYKKASVWCEFTIKGYDCFFIGKDPKFNNVREEELAKIFLHEEHLEKRYIRDILEKFFNYKYQIPDLLMKNTEIASSFSKLIDRVTNIPQGITIEKDTFKIQKGVSYSGRDKSLLNKALNGMQLIQFLGKSDNETLNDAIKLEGVKLSEIRKRIIKQSKTFESVNPKLDIKKLNVSDIKQFQIKDQITIKPISERLVDEKHLKINLNNRVGLETLVTDYIYNPLEQYEQDLSYSIQEFDSILESYLRPYYVGTKSQKNGDHEVHIGSCDHKPKMNNSLFLGYFLCEEDAVKAAKKIYPQSNGCSFCCPRTNTDK